MAVVKNFWLRDNTQKLGGAVIYQAKGQTLMRQLAPAISNPRTDAQMEQRVKLANLVAFYRASAQWMRGAFEAKPDKQSDYNAFVSANVANNKVYLTKSQVESGNGIVAPYQVTRGSLGEVVQTASATQIVSNLYLGDLAITAETKVSELSASLLANNNGLLEGDQLSVIQYIQNTATSGNYTITCRAYEMILSRGETSPISDYLPTDILTKSAGTSPALAVNTSGFTGGVAFVISRTTANRLLVSSSVVTLTSGNTIYATMSTTTQKERAIKSYGTGTITFLDSNVADTTTSEVTTDARIIAMNVRGQTYDTNGIIPWVYNAGDTIILTLSAPVSVAANAPLIISTTTGNTEVNATSTNATTLTSTQHIFNVTASTTIAEGDEATVEMELADDSVVTANFRTDGGNGEGLG